MPRHRPFVLPIASSDSKAARRGWFGRQPKRNQAAARITSAASAGLMAEELESRTYLTTFTGAGSYIYEDAAHHNIEINYNDVTFEALAATVDAGTGQATITNLVPGVLSPGVDPTIGADLYSIYVTQSATDSFISISQINEQGNLTPYSGAVATFTGTTITGAVHVVTEQSGTGVVLIGAIDPISDPASAILSIPYTTQIGLEPVPTSGQLTPGITVIPVNASTGEQNDFGNFLVGGTVWGTVSFGANLNEFYAGAVMTGESSGGVLGSSVNSVNPVAGNFSVAGDLREFLTDGSVGTDAFGPTVYVTDFDLTVGGQLGEVRVGGAGAAGLTADFAGTIEAADSKYISGLLSYPTGTTDPITGDYTGQTEVETYPPTPSPIGDEFETGGVNLTNNTLGSAQILGSVPVTNAVTGLPIINSDGVVDYQADVIGELQLADGDSVDNYAVPMMAGTTFQATIADTAGLLMSIYDPSGRLIASNVVDNSGTREDTTGTVQVTTDRPGLYKFEISSVLTGIDIPYELTVSNVGNMGIGGIYVSGDYSDIGFNSAISAAYGDLGALAVVGNYTSETAGPTPSTDTSVPSVSPTSISVPDGNLRAIIAGSIGTEANLVLSGGPYLYVPSGSVGLIKSTTGVLDLHSQFDPNYLNLSTPVYKTDDADATAIGGSIQAISAATTFEGEVATNAGIGSIEAADFNTNIPSYFDVNADNIGNDGIIDLIDVPGTFGNLLAGGPSFVTNDGGQIRYMDLGGAVFRPDSFGGGIDSPIIYNAGQSVQLTTDAGDTITASPVGQTTTNVTTPASTATNSTTTTTTTGPQLTVLTYPVTDKGGQVPVSISSTGGLLLTGNGNGGTNSQVTIGSISISGEGRDITPATSLTTGAAVDDQFGNQELQIAAAPTTTTTITTTDNADGSTTTTTVTGDATDLSLTLGGTATVDVLNVTGTVTSMGGAVVSIINNTPGEIASITAPAIGQILTRGNLGFATPVATAAAVLPQQVINGGNTYPFVQQHTGVVITGDAGLDILPDAINIDVGGAVGNINVNAVGTTDPAAGQLDNLIANYSVSSGNKGATPIAGQIDGIVGPIVVQTVLNVDIGQELAPTGTGLVGFSGIFATGQVGIIDNNNNPNGDIRGNIVTSETLSTTNTALTAVGIDQISLTNASIINCAIATIVGTNWVSVSQYGSTTVVVPSGDANPFQSPYVYSIGAITVRGLGGIIGADVICSAMGPITVNDGGFGILESTFGGAADARYAGFTVSGYGMRECNISDIAYLGPIDLTGNGSLVSVLTYPIDVRESDNGSSAIDPYFDTTPTVDTDLNDALGTTAQYPNIANVTDTGVMEDCVIEGQETFTGLTAVKVRTANPIYTYNPLPEPSPPNIPVIGETYSMSIDFGAAIGYIHVSQLTDGLQVTTGKLGVFSPSSNVNRVGIDVAGKIGNITIHGNFGEFITSPTTGDYIPDSYIDASGPSGTIGKLVVTGNLYGDVSASGEIDAMVVGGNVDGTITSHSQGTPTGLGALRVGGTISNGALNIQGNVGSIIVNGSLGAAGDSLTINGNANLIQVGANKLPGADMALALTINGTLNKLSVYGKVTGSVATTGNINNLYVLSDGSANVISGNISVGGRIGTAQIIGGNITSSITAEGYINAFTLIRGSVYSTGTIESSLDSIRSFKITGGTGYGLYGSLLAPNGINENIDISGNLGDGTNPAAVTTGSGNVFRIRGSIESNTTIAVHFGLNSLLVDGNVDVGAVISAHPIRKQKIFGANDGTITSS